jgi:hypothetical protein
MSSPKPTDPPAPPVKVDILAAVLSYLVPGLGQILQGRVGKGVLFLVGLYGLFFYGMALGSWKNVYLPDYHGPKPGNQDPGTVSRLASDIYTRFQFVGQFPIGMAAWPAVYQYREYKEDAQEVPMRGFMRAPTIEELNQLQRDGDKTWDLGWVYTVIAGVLNVLVIYDALAGPAFRETKGNPQSPNGGPAK